MSNLLVFDSRKNSTEKPPIKLFINDEELEQKDFAKYLGLTTLKLLITMKNLFNSFLKSYIEYRNFAWDGAPKTKIEV